MPEPVFALTPQAVPDVLPQAAAGILELLDGHSEPVVAGERLNADLLRRFYARHGFEPVWTARQGQARSLVEAILRASDQGLDPDLFHANLLRDEATPPLEHELLLSDAFLSYASALAFGAVPAGRRRDDEALTPKPVDVAAVLDVAMRSPDPAEVIEALAPTTPTYRALRAALQTYRSRTSAGEKIATEVLRKIDVNLERERWLPRPLPVDRVWVNAAEERLAVFQADKPVFSTRVVVGEDIVRNQTPEFSTMIEASLYNPPWVVPTDIVSREILPKIKEDPNYLTRNNMILLPNGEAEQLPGPEAGLGYLMFDMPNRFDVYLHDTPDREIFDRTNRRISHGCIRVQNPREFAALLMQEPIETINEGIAMGGTTRHKLPTPVPVFVVYETASVDTNGKLQFYPDFYNRDAEIWQKLQPHPQAQGKLVQSVSLPTPPNSVRHDLRPAMPVIRPLRLDDRPRNPARASRRSHIECCTAELARPSRRTHHR